MSCSYLIFFFVLELISSKVWSELLSSMSANDLTEEFANKSLGYWKMHLESLIRRRSESMAKFLWLQISKERFEEAVTNFDNPEFYPMSILLKEGTYKCNLLHDPPGSQRHVGRSSRSAN